MVPMEAIAKRIQRNDEEFDGKTIEEWKKSFVSLAASLDALKQEADCAKSVVDSAEYREKRAKLLSDTSFASASARSSTSNPSDELKQYIRQKIAQDVRKTSTSQGQISKSIKKVFKLSADSAMDDDLEVIETDDTEQTYKCPYSGKLMEQPMKSTVCIHRIDKTSVDAQLQNNHRNSFKCPIPGCQGQWTKANCSIDEEFIARMKRFFRLKERATASALSQAHAVDDDGYTDV
jgi:hypothetical protein